MLQGNNTDKPAGSEKIILKKYGKNRRLYDTAASRYVNLEELAALIRKGTEVQVLEAQSGEDLTRQTLMQIIVEDAKDKPTVLPLDLLRQLIVASDHAGREFIVWYLSSAFDAYRKVQGALENGITEVQSAAASPLRMMRSFIQSTKSQKPEENSELLELRRRIAELEARLAKPKARVPRRKPRSQTSS